MTRDTTVRCRHCLHAEGFHPHGGVCSLEVCEGICPGWDPRRPGEPAEPDSRCFRGRRLPGGTCVVVVVNRYLPEAGGVGEMGRRELVSEHEHVLPARRDLWDHSPTGFEWGYGGSGPAQLALAVLAKVLSDRAAVRLHQDFKRDFIAVIAREGDEVWEIEEQDVVDWQQRVACRGCWGSGETRWCLTHDVELTDEPREDHPEGRCALAWQPCSDCAGTGRRP